MQHPFYTQIKGRADDLLHDCNSFQQYMNNLMEISVDLSTSRMYGFQALIEAIIVYFELLDNYRVIPGPEARENLVHGVGTNKQGHPCAVSIFHFLKNESTITTNKSAASTFFDKAHRVYNAKRHVEDTHWVFCNNDGWWDENKSNFNPFHHFTWTNFVEEIGLDKCYRIFARRNIEEMIDNNQDFWNYFYKQINTLTNFVITKKSPRPHQLEALDWTREHKKGRIILPVATGKTFVESLVISDVIKENPTAVIAFATPRIPLTQQILKEVFEYLYTHNIDAEYISLNSDEYDDNYFKKLMHQAGFERISPTRRVWSTTSPRAIAHAYDRSQNEGIPLIIASTYHSLPRLLEVKVGENRDEMLPLHLLLNDEAHNLIMGRFSDIIKTGCMSLIEMALRVYFITATQAVSSYQAGLDEQMTSGECSSSDGRGMENKKIFGPKFAKSACELLQAGELVKVFLEKIIVNEAITRRAGISTKKRKLKPEEVENNPKIMAAIVEEAFMALEKKNKKYSADPSKIGSKLFVVCRGTPALQAMFKSPILRELQDKHNVILCGLSTDTRARVCYPGENDILLDNSYFRQEFMDHARQFSDSQNAIIFHIDMLGEGIDLPNLNGVVSFRDLGDIRYNQTIGRVMRLLYEDRIKIYTGEIKPSEYRKMIKPFSWIFVPEYLGCSNSFSNKFQDLLIKIRDELGYIPCETWIGGPGGAKNIPSYPDTKEKQYEIDEAEYEHITEPAFRDEIDKLNKLIAAGLEDGDRKRNLYDKEKVFRSLIRRNY